MGVPKLDAGPEDRAIHTMTEPPAFDPPFDIVRPERETLPFLFNSPHSGRTYPPAFLKASRLDAQALRRSEDAYVDELFAFVAELGAPLMRARFPRAYLDVNREPYELDPVMFEGRLPSHANTRSMRVAGGLGTIPRIVGDAQEIYARRLPAAEAMRRIEALYEPYHAGLRQLLWETHEAFGFAILFDCHSMPSTSFAGSEAPRADIVIGDRFGASCSRLLTDAVERELKGRGYRTLRNKPYAGGFITEHYGRPALGRHAIQIEICRSLYMDEATLRPHEGLARVCEDLRGLVLALAGLPLHALAAPGLAAE